MFFTSGQYMIFLAVVFFAYWLLATPRRRVPVIFLLVASYYFYALWNPKFLALVFLVSTVDFLTARFIGASENARRRKTLLSASIPVDIDPLYTFTNVNFYSSSLTELLSGFRCQASPLLLNVIWPIGLSFFTFRCLS